MRARQCVLLMRGAHVVKRIITYLALTVVLTLCGGAHTATTQRKRKQIWRNRGASVSRGSASN